MKASAMAAVAVMAVLIVITQYSLNLSPRRTAQAAAGRDFTVSRPVETNATLMDADEAGADEPPHVRAFKRHQRENLGFDAWLHALNDGLTQEDMRYLGKNCSETSPCRVAICTSIYLEEPYLEEWVNYQLLMGIEHIYFVLLLTAHYAARRSAHYTQALLRPYVQRGQVSVRELMNKWDVPRVMDQIDGIGQCFRRTKDRVRWLVTTDVDEFYFSRTAPTWNHLVALAEEKKVDALPIPWYMFGSSGHDHKPAGLTGDVYWRRSNLSVYDSETSDYFGRRNGKVLFRASCFKNFKDNTHRVILQDGCSAAPFVMGEVEYHFKHYQLKSFDDFCWKRRGNGFTGVRVQHAGRGWWNSISRNFRQEWTEQDRQFNDTDDFDLRLYTGALRRVLPPPSNAWWETDPNWFRFSWIGPKEPGHGKGPPIV